EMLCLMSEVKVSSMFSAQCITVSCRSGGGQRTSSQTAWLGGGSSSRKRGFITAVDLQTNTVTSKVHTRIPILLPHVCLLTQENGQPVKTLTVGNISTPLMCLGQSTHSLDNRSVWAGCGTKILSFSVDYDVCKSIDTRPHPIFHRQRPLSSEAFVSRMVVDKHVYLSKAGTPTVEVWDKRSERMVDCINCSQIIRYTLLHTDFLCSTSQAINVLSPCRQESGCRRGSRVQLPSEASPSWATVKALMMQNTAVLWIGTRGGYLLLLELSNHQTLQVMAPSCNSICSISSAFKRGSPI
ncbi:hypothetical protein GOODEAATRI_029465, partial [Goodea atripinnis]